MVLLTDNGEFDLLMQAYEGEYVTVGLCNLEVDDDEQLDPTPDEDVITDYDINLIVGDEEPAGSIEDDIPDNKVDIKEEMTLDDVQSTEPDRNMTYEPEVVQVGVSNIRKDAGFSSSTDLSAKLYIPMVKFDVSDNERYVNAVYIKFERTDNLHFVALLDSDKLLYDVETLSVTDIELYIE